MSHQKTSTITGVTGKDGSCLTKLFLEKIYHVSGLRARQFTFTIWRLRELGIENQIGFIDGDIANARANLRAVLKVNLSEFYNLGAQSSVGSSWFKPELLGNPGIAKADAQFGLAPKNSLDEPISMMVDSGIRRLST